MSAKVVPLAAARFTRSRNTAERAAHGLQSRQSQWASPGNSTGGVQMSST